MKKELSLDKFINKNLKAYDDFFVSFQHDIIKIVQRYRHDYHLLSAEDIISEINFDFLKKKDVFLKNCFEDENCKEELTFEIFQKYAFVFVRNKINWSHYKVKNSKYVSRRNDGQYETDEGIKTSFEISTENEGEIDESFESFDKNDYINNFFYVLDNYSGILKPDEMKILSYLSKDLTHDQIASKMNVTHQAISFRIKCIKQKIQSRFKLKDIYREDSFENVQKGKDAINKVFEISEDTFSNDCKSKLIDFVFSHPNKYTAQELNEKLFEGKFSIRQISSFLISKKMHKLINYTERHLYMDKKEDIVDMLTKGFDNKTISDKYSIPLRSVAGIRSSLVAKGELESIKK